MLGNKLLRHRATCFLSPFLPQPLAKVSYHQRCKSHTTQPKARLKVEILAIGKQSGKDKAFDAPIEEYIKRMSPTVSVSERFIKQEAAFKTISTLSTRTPVILLDENGLLPRDSVQFAKIVFDALERGGSRLAIVIGEADGLPPDIVQLKGPQVQLLSLSPLTFTHKMVRLFLYEQLYRATEIRANTKYHRPIERFRGKRKWSHDHRNTMNLSAIMDSHSTERLYKNMR